MAFLAITTLTWNFYTCPHDPPLEHSSVLSELQNDFELANVCKSTEARLYHLKVYEKLFLLVLEAMYYIVWNV